MILWKVSGRVDLYFNFIGKKNQFDNTGPFFSSDEFCQLQFWGIMFMYVEGRGDIYTCMCMQKFKFSNAF